MVSGSYHVPIYEILDVTSLAGWCKLWSDHSDQHKVEIICMGSADIFVKNSLLIDDPFQSSARFEVLELEENRDNKYGM